MTPDNYRDDDWERERNARPDAANARRARRFNDSNDDEYVDWSKTRRLTPQRRVKKSNVLAFGVPFILASIGLLWFSLHGHNNTLSRYAERSAAERADTNNVDEKKNNDDEQVALDLEAREESEEALGEQASVSDQETNDEMKALERNGYRIVSHMNPESVENKTLEDLDVQLNETSEIEATIPEEAAWTIDLPVPEREYNLPSFTNESNNTTDEAIDETPDDETTDALFDSAQESDVELEEEVKTQTLETPEVGGDELDADFTSMDESDALDISSDDSLASLDAELEGDAIITETTPESAPPTGHTEEELTALRGQITQLEFALDRIKASDLRDPDETLEALDAPLADARKLHENAPEELQEDARLVLEKFQTFSDFLVQNADFLRRLETLDDAVMTNDGARAFFAPYLEPNPASNKQKAPEIVQYEEELAHVAQTLEPLRAVDEWNAFVEENGERLEKFHVGEQAAQNALNFIENARKTPATPPEIALLQKRENEWRYDVEHKLATQRKVILALDKENSKTYWTYAPAVNLFYYLPEQPKPGVNAYFSDPQGAVKYMRIPESAKEIELEESPQKTQLAALVAMAWKIPDDLREQDTAQWYARWCELLTTTLKSDQLDPLLQYALFKEFAEVLSASDYRFENRLAPLLKVLNAPQLEEQASVNRYLSENDDVKALRLLAASRLRFVPKDHLVVNKTTEQLDAQIESCSFRYRRVGWLDRDFADEPKLRRGNNVETPDGELWVFVSKNEETFWRKIGDVQDGQINLTIASNAIPRGSIVFCRTPLRTTVKTARRNVEDAIFRR